MTSPKYIFITGGVCSSLGKGTAIASIGTLLKAAGLKVCVQKMDPYLNIDPGTMSPFQHGEVFVTNDGAETDLDLGHYERFIDENLTEPSSVSTGKIYSEVLGKERKGTFLGGTIQIIPHITNAIQNRIISAATQSKADVMLVEIGGTVGDIEGLPFLEAIRQMRYKLGHENTLFIHLTLLPYLEASKELKTKPTQASVRELRSIGIQPDIIIARADQKISKELLKKISLFCDVGEEAVIPGTTVKSIYEVPLIYEDYHMTELIAKKLNLGKLKPDLKAWRNLVGEIKAHRPVLKIGLVGKYTGLGDAYLSVIESLKIACYHNKRKLKTLWIDSEKLEQKDKEAWKDLKSCDGILVPGGFGIRGIEGKVMAAKYARENKIPYFGLCLGMQIMSIEFARAMLKDSKITSEEFDEQCKLDKSKYIIHFLPGQSHQRDKGGTLRLGAYPCKLTKGTLTEKAYKTDRIEERHRHRYEFNNDYIEKLEPFGFIISGLYEKEKLVEIAEIKGHPFMIGTQFHPEFLSRPLRPHPLFFAFIKQAAQQTATK
ncbi:MAG: CTP synthase, CTP synthase [Candidatus Peregrinibacteria bacterium GW2011_GWF2_38_29]|nr:MAG: CTP synthase, CTP synthase [Candidatus Peregrinibacteria bacterium GW2011_GWF2_38_29]HBB02255.1 CTP synthase [Candidatus Peregrinibacteria bacterium]